MNLEGAQLFASRAHRGQVGPTGEPLTDHITRVATATRGHADGVTQSERHESGRQDEPEVGGVTLPARVDPGRCQDERQQHERRRNGKRPKHDTITSHRQVVTT